MSDMENTGKSEGEFTHFDRKGDPSMVDVTDKPESDRVAIAAGSIFMRPDTLALVRTATGGKGDVFSVAQLAGIMGAKQTANLIPLCHPLKLSSVKVDLGCDDERSCVDIVATCRIRANTGVEMEAMTAVMVTALTVYDMCKASDRAMLISDVRLVYKSGGASGTYQTEPEKTGENS